MNYNISDIEIEGYIEERIIDFKKSTLKIAIEHRHSFINHILNIALITFEENAKNGTGIITKQEFKFVNSYNLF